MSLRKNEKRDGDHRDTASEGRSRSVLGAASLGVGSGVIALVREWKFTYMCAKLILGRRVIAAWQSGFGQSAASPL